MKSGQPTVKHEQTDQLRKANKFFFQIAKPYMEPEQPHADLGVSNFGLQVVVQAGISQDMGQTPPVRVGS